jgi:hypothetical protein
MSRNTASRQERIGDVLFVTVKHPRQSLKRAFSVPMMAVVLSSWTVWSGAAGEPDPGDLVSMLDRVAIVEAIALACEESRPDLAAPFREAQQRWWVRNAQIHETLVSLEQEIGTPRAKAFLDYFSSLQRSLRKQIKDRQHSGNTEYAARCDDVLQDLTDGRLDYRLPTAAKTGGDLAIQQSRASQGRAGCCCSPQGSRCSSKAMEELTPCTGPCLFPSSFYWPLEAP